MMSSGKFKSNQVSWVKLSLAALALLLGAYLLVLIFTKPKYIMVGNVPCPPEPPISGEEKQCMEQLQRIGAALLACRQAVKTIPNQIVKLYPNYLSSGTDLICSSDEFRAPLIKEAEKGSFPQGSSYSWQVSMDEKPIKVGELVIPPDAPFPQVYAKRGEEYPISVCVHHQTPEQRRVNCPRLWLVLRLNGKVERVFRFVWSSQDL